MTGKASAQHDDSDFYLITDVEHIVKQVIRTVQARRLRWVMWTAWTEAASTFPAASAEYPWEIAAHPVRVHGEAAKDALLKMLYVVPDTGERDRLARVVAREAEKAEQRMASGIPDSGITDAGPVSVLRCQYCGNPIPAARGPQARFCKNSHRVNAHRRAKREAERAANAAPAGSR